MGDRSSTTTYMKNYEIWRETAPGNDQINFETLKSGEYNISKTLAKLYPKCWSERRIPTAWKNAKMVITITIVNKKDLNNYRPMSTIKHKALTKVLTKRLDKTLDETQSREQAGFRSGYSTTDHIHVVNQLTNWRRSAENIISLSSSHSSTIRKPSTQCKLKQYWPRRQSTYTKKATRSTSEDEYDREISYRPSCLRQHWKAYSDLGNQ